MRYPSGHHGTWPDATVTAKADELAARLAEALAAIRAVEMLVAEARAGRAA